MNIRLAKPGDLDALTKLWHELMDLHAELDPFFQVVPEADHLARAQFAENMIDDHRRVWVATAKNVVIGFVTASRVELHAIYPRRERVSISDICVSAMYRRQGLGRALIEAVNEWAESLDVNAIDLHVAWANPESRAFWKAMGFEERLIVMERQY